MKSTGQTQKFKQLDVDMRTAGPAPVDNKELYSTGKKPEGDYDPKIGPPPEESESHIKFGGKFQFKTSKASPERGFKKLEKTEKELMIEAKENAYMEAQLATSQRHQEDRQKYLASKAA